VGKCVHVTRATRVSVAPLSVRVTEVWESQADFEAWFEASVKPAFSEGGPMPTIAFDELNEVVTP
jgi:hypothetical protein